MPRIIRARLTAAGVPKIDRRGLFADGGGLYLHVGGKASNGHRARSWIHRVTINRRRHDIGIGPYPTVSLAEARRRVLKQRLAILDGQDPLAAKQAERVPTFRAAAEATYERRRPGWRSANEPRWWRQRLEKYVLPTLGDRRVSEISRQDVLRAVLPVMTETPETGRKVRGAVKAVFEWAQSEGYRTDNPAGEVINGALPRNRGVKNHFPALAYQEVPAALALIRAARAPLPVRACLEWTILTACRSGEARGATWAEIDEAAREWRVPAERMKMKDVHRVPLSEAALAVLRQMQPFREPSNLVFPAARAGRGLGNNVMNKLMRKLELGGVPHGFRASFRTWAQERTSFSMDIAEAALAHNVGTTVQRAYARSDWFAKRRRLMDAWGAFVTGKSAKVVSMRA